MINILKKYSLTYYNEVGAGSLSPHHPSDSSGVTIGCGYDLKHKTKKQVESDLSNIGIDADIIDRLKKGVSLTGDEAFKFCFDNRDIEITENKQKSLFNTTLGKYEENAIKHYNKMFYNDSISKLKEDIKNDKDYSFYVEHIANGESHLFSYENIDLDTCAVFVNNVRVDYNHFGDNLIGLKVIPESLDSVVIRKHIPSYQELPVDIKDLIFDFTYNLGSIKTFPKFFTALLTGDRKGAYANYKRFTGGVPLGRRNDDTRTKLNNIVFRNYLG